MSVPEDFVSYSYPGEFGLSFPRDWDIDLAYESSTDEIFQRIIGSPDAPLLGMVQTVFYGGLPGASGFNPLVSINVVPRFDGYENLDEIYALDASNFEEYLPEYKELSVERTIINGREVLVTDSQDNQPEYGKKRYLILTTTGPGLVWYVSCSAPVDDYPRWENTFRQILGSFEIYQ